MSDTKIVTLTKAFTILKLLRYVQNANILVQGIKKSSSSFTFLIFLLIVANFSFGTMAYYAEKSNPKSGFNKGIPMALWWTIVTMTTTGYGDIVPITPTGKIIGGIVSIFGMLVLTLPVVILGYHFEEVYNERQAEIMIKKMKDKEFKDKGNINPDQKEDEFLKKRISSIEYSNSRVMDLLGHSGKIYKYVSRDLKSLYQTIYAEAAITGANGSEKEIGSGTINNQIKAMEKFAAAKRKIKLVNLFKNGFNTIASRRSSEHKNSITPKCNNRTPKK